PSSSGLRFQLRPKTDLRGFFRLNPFFIRSAIPTARGCFVVNLSDLAGRLPRLSPTSKLTLKYFTSTLHHSPIIAHAQLPPQPVEPRGAERHPLGNRLPSEHRYLAT